MARAARTRRGHSRWIRMLMGTIGLGLLAGSAGDPLDGPLPSPPAQDYSRLPMLAVVDVPAGDVLVVRHGAENQNLRLIGVLVPAAGTAADQARLFLSRMLTGESVYVEYEPDGPAPGRENRRRAYVYRVPDGLFVNLELIRQGYAPVSVTAPFEHEEFFQSYERLARLHEKGIWLPAATAVSDPPASRPAADGVRTSEAGNGEGHSPVSTPACIVYVTRTGRKYHTKDCQHVRSGGQPMSLKQAQERGYTPCSRCKPPQ